MYTAPSTFEQHKAKMATRAALKANSAALAQALAALKAAAK